MSYLSYCDAKVKICLTGTQVSLPSQSEETRHWSSELSLPVETSIHRHSIEIIQEFMEVVVRVYL